MVKNQKVSGTAWSMPAGLAWGAGISGAVTLAGALISAHLISEEIIAQQQIGYCSMVILLLASCLGAHGAVRRIKHRVLYVSAMAGGVYYGLLLSCTALFFGGIYQGMGATGLMVLGGSVLAVLIHTKGEGRRNRRRSKIRHR